MAVAEKQLTEQTGWRLGFRSLEDEVHAEMELEVAGTIPAGLDGTLYRVGPARHDVYGERYRHWFDGDGMVHALRLAGGKAHYRNRFVQTAKKRAEDAAGRRITGAFGTRPAGSPIRRMRSIHGNAANTNVVFHGGRLLALWEGGHPHELDPVTLETIGTTDLGGVLGGHDAFSAHPKLDRDTGEMWNHGITYGPRPTLSIYRCASDGVVERAARIKLPIQAMVHDFALTATKVIVVIVPIALPAIPLGLLTGQRSFGDSLRWRPAQGTRIAVIDRASGDVRWYQTDPFMLFHVANAWDEDGDAVVDLCAYPDDRVMRFFTEVMVGQVGEPAEVFLERLRLTAEGGVQRRRLSETTLEFPRVAGRALCRPHTRVYGVSYNDAGEFLGVPTAIDTETGATSQAPTRPAEFAGELVPVTKPGASSDEDVWLLTLVLDADAKTSEVRVLDGADLGAPPVATVRLPHVVPFGFHGNFHRFGTGSSAPR